MPATGNVMLGRQGIAALEALHRASQPGGEEDRRALEGWPGWGPFAPAFDPEVPEEWQPIARQLADLLDDEAYEDAKLCVDNSFYTSERVVALVYRLLAATGVGDEATGRPLKALEPGCGSGRFIAGTPVGWQLDWTGVEADKTSAAIAQALHPGATIMHRRLEKTTVPDDSFDIAAGNVPFSSQHVYDSADHKYLSLHNYFIARALAAVHEGVFLAS